jgi:Undecaprenyl-phosphate glucose phosphotransferase
VFYRFQRFFNQVKFLVDVCALVGSFALAYALRFHGHLFAVESIPPRSDTLAMAVMALILYPLAFRWSGLYTTSRSRTHLGEMFAVFRGVAMATLLLAATTYFVRGERYSRLTLILFASIAFVSVSSARIAFRSILENLRRLGHNLREILVVGAGDLACRVIDTIEQHRELGFRVVGLLTRRASKVGSTVNGIPVIGTLDDLETALAERRVDQVIIALPSEEQALMRKLMDVLALHTVDVKVVPDLYQYITLCGGLEEFGGIPIINLQSGPLQGWNLVLKRAFDVLAALAALAVTAPAMILTAIAVKLTSEGPIFYRQERMGMDGHVFSMLKFRTMMVGAEPHGAVMTGPDDPRRTVIGAFLRRTSLDELPQLFNVLWGDMSLVGPRPERPRFIDEFKRKIPRYQLRHKVKAGMTGWAQVHGLRGRTSIEDRLSYDLYYIENWSLALDLRILMRTALGGFLSKNAY